MPPESPADPCILPSVQPLLNELKHPVSIDVHSEGDPGREQVETFIQRVFDQSYGAQLSAFYPTLLSFRHDGILRAAVGVRPARGGETFAEHYLHDQVESLIANRWEQAVSREAVAEVGNLALVGPGEARWVIAAVTTFLHARGYRWVLFTAVRPLVNAFQRLGLSPVQLTEADPARLSDGGRAWGRYYDERPVVCVGDILSGYRKLGGSIAEHQPRLARLLSDAFQAAAADDRAGIGRARCVG